MEEQSKTDIEEEIIELEPQVTSPDPNERKLARNLRIQRRLEALKRKEEEGYEEEEEEGECLSKLQIEKSVKVLKELLEEGQDRVTNIKVAGDARERDRREQQAETRKQIVRALEEEAQLAEAAFDGITANWSLVLTNNDPLHIHERLQEQKARCDEVIRQKDIVIAMLKDEIQQAEVKYTMDQRKHIDDICLLTNRIEKQIMMTKKAYREQLKLIEESIEAERKILTETNSHRWEELYKQRDEEETKTTNEKERLLEQFQIQMTDLRRDFQEKYRDTKIKLERDVDELEKELEHIKALAMLNTEKMDYNYQILRKREDENSMLRAQQKRRINKLQDIANSWKRKISDYEQKTRQDIARTRLDIAKLQKSILDIDAKSDRFAELNDLKFRDLWDMNIEKAMKYAQKILAIDRILHEQVLGVEWSYSGILDDEDLKKENLPSYRRALEILAAEKKRAPGAKSRGERVPMREDLLRNIMEKIGDRVGFPIEDRLQAILEPYTKQDQTLVKADNIFVALDVQNQADIDGMLQYFYPYMHCPICDQKTWADRQAPPIPVQAKTEIPEVNVVTVTRKTSPDHSSDDTESEIYELDLPRLPGELDDGVLGNVLEEYSDTSEEEDESSTEKVIAIATEEKSRTQSETMSTTPSKKTESNTTVADSFHCEQNHPLVISTVYILKALREFITNYFPQKPSLSTMADRLSKNRYSICRLIDEADIKLYWEKFRNIFTEEDEAVWNVLADGLNKYHDILKDRKTLNAEVAELRKQNHELKSLLKDYTDQAKCATPENVKSRNV